MIPLDSRLYKTNDTKEQREEFKQLYVLASPVLKRIREVIESEVKAIENDMQSKTHYEKYSWPMYQADRIGAIRALKEIKNLVKELDI